jgi:hypothetical protein
MLLVVSDSRARLSDRWRVGPMDCAGLAEPGLLAHRADKWARLSALNDALL